MLVIVPEVSSENVGTNYASFANAGFVEYTSQMQKGTEAEIKYLPKYARIFKAHISHTQKLIY